MSTRIAHRPRYRTMHQFTYLPINARHPMFRTRWSYRKQTLTYEKHPPGYSLSLIPIRYRLMNSIIVYPVL